MQGNEVYTAFEILLEEIEVVANQLHEKVVQAFNSGDYHTVRRAIEEAARLSEFREKVRALQKEWSSLLAGKPLRLKKKSRKAQSRLLRGLRTPEDAFRRPILEALVELGGSASVGQVLDLVERKMQGKLTQYDLEPLPSSPHCLRWRNTARRCRNTLVREGLMKRDSPHGIWEISDLGRKALQDEG